MTMPQFFSNEREKILANYNWIDIATGTGVIVYYGYNTINDTTYTYNLSEKIVFSHSTNSEIGSIPTQDLNMLNRGELDFDLSTFNMPQTIKGTAFLNLGFGVSNNDNAGSSVYMIAKIKKWDGTTETTLATSQTQTITTASGATGQARASMQLSLTETHFKKGETLRLTIESWGKFNSLQTASSGATIHITHSPENQDGGLFTVAGIKTTQLKLNIPFKINL